MPIDLNKGYDPKVYGVTILNNPYSNVKPINITEKSDYDKGFVLPTQGADPYQELYEYRAQNQPFYDQLANSLAKGTVLAGTTFVDTFAGTAAGLINVLAKAAEEGDTNASELLNAFIANPISQGLNDINTALDSGYLPNYRTKRELDNEWYENMFSATGAANFWGETVLKNSGFMVGAGLAGKAISSLLSRLVRLEEGRKEFKTIQETVNKMMDGKDLPKNSLDELLTTVRDAPETYEVAQAKILQDFAKAASSVRNKTNAIQVASATLGSFGEARLEALGNGEGYRMERENELKSLLSNGSITPEEYEAKVQTLNKEVEAFQNASWLLNTMALTGSNYLGWRNTFLKPYDYAVKNRLGEAVKITEGAEKGLYKYIEPGKIGKTFKGLSPIIRESQEEQLQFAIQKGVGEYVRDKYDHTGELQSILNGFAKGFSEAYGTSEGWENAFAGALFGTIGIPGMGGGIYNEFKEMNEQTKNEAQAVTNLNNYIKEFGLNDKAQPLLKAIIKDFNLKKKQNFAIDNDDRYTYEETADQKFFNLANAFIEAGKFEDLIEIYKQETNLSEEEIKAKYSYEEDKKGVKSKKSYFESRTPDEIRQYINEKSNNAIRKITELRDLKDNLETLYRNELVSITDNEGKEMSIKVKDFLTENFYMAEDRQKRLNQLRSKLINDIDYDTFISLFGEDYAKEFGVLDIGSLLTKIDEKLSSKYGEWRVDEVKKSSKEAKEALEKQNLAFSKLIEKLNAYQQATYKISRTKDGKIKRSDTGKAMLTPGSFKKLGLLKDYIKLLNEQRLSNFALMQLSNNNFSKLIQELKQKEAEVKEEITKKKELSEEDQLKYDTLIKQAADAGYDKATPVVYFKLKKYGDRLLKAVYNANNQRVVVFADTNKPVRNVIRTKKSKTKKGESVEIDIFNKDYLIKKYGEITFIKSEDAIQQLNKDKMNLNKQMLIEAFYERSTALNTEIESLEKEISTVKTIRDAKLKAINSLKKDIQDSKWDRAFTELRKEWKKNLKILENELEIIDSQLNTLNSLRDQLAKDINILKEFSESIMSMNQLNDITDLENKLFQKAYEYSENNLDNIEILIDGLEDEKRKILDVIKDLENMLKLSDVTIKSLYSVLNATFKNEWGFIKDIDRYSEYNLDAIKKKLKIYKFKIKEYAARKGITYDEALNNILDSLSQLKLAKENAQTLYSIENHLALNKEDLKQVQSRIDDLYTQLEKKYKDEKFYNYYNVLNRNFKELQLIYNRILIKYESKLKINDSQYSGLDNEGEKQYSTDSTFTDMDANSLSGNLFYGTGKHALGNKVNGVYIDDINPNGTPVLNQNPHSLRYIKFVNANYKLLNNPETSKNIGIQIFKVNDPNTPEAFNRMFLEMLGDNAVPAKGSFVAVLIDKKTGNPILSTSNGLRTLIPTEGSIVFQFLPLSDNLLNPELGAKVNLDSLKRILNENGYTNTIFNHKDKDGNTYSTYEIAKQGSQKEEFTDKGEFEQRIITIAHKIHSEFIARLDAELSKNNKVYLEVGGTNLGIPVKKTPVNSEGKRTTQRINPYETLKAARGVSLTDKGRISNGAIKLVSNEDQVKETKLKKGTLYIDLSTGERIPLNTAYLNDEEVQVILHLLNHINEKSGTPLMDITMDLPKGNYITLGGEEKTKIPICAKGNTLSVMNTLIMWGKSKSPNKYDIYINDNNVYFAGEKLPLSDVLNYSKNTNLIKFLLGKKHNVNAGQLNTKGYYFRPVLVNGKLEFKKYDSYEQYLLTENKIYSTIATSNDNNYSNNLIFLSRNIIFATNKGLPIMNINTTFGETPKPNPIVTPAPNIPGQNATTVVRTPVNIGDELIYKEGSTYETIMVTSNGNIFNVIFKKENGDIVLISSNTGKDSTLDGLKYFNSNPKEAANAYKSNGWNLNELTNITIPTTPIVEAQKKEECEVSTSSVSNTAPTPTSGEPVAGIDPNSLGL